MFPRKEECTDKQTQNFTIMYYKFSDTAKAEDELWQYKVYEIHEKLVNNKKLTSEEKHWLSTRLSWNGTYKLLGWKFDFKQWLMRVVYRYKCDTFFNQCYCVNKTWFKNVTIQHTKPIEIYYIENKLLGKRIW